MKEIALDQEPEMTTALKRIAGVVTRCLPVIGIYCLGAREGSLRFFDSLNDNRDPAPGNYQFYLFILAEKIENNDVGNLSDIVINDSKGLYSVTLLLHSAKQLLTATGAQKGFFANVLNKGWKVAGEQPFDYPTPSVDKERNKPSIDYISARLEMARSLLTLGDDLQNPLLAAVFLHYALEQLFLAGIYAGLGYYPNHFHLSYLYELCNYCQRIPETVFPGFLFHQMQFREILNANHNSLRFRSANIFELERVRMLQEYGWELFRFIECKGASGGNLGKEIKSDL